MLGEIIVVEHSEVNSALLEGAPYEGRASASWKQLNEFHFTALWCIFLNIAYSDEYESELDVVTASSGETWFLLLPNELRDLIAGYSKGKNSDVVAQWSRIDEFKWGFKEGDVQELFDDLVRLAKLAIEQNKALIYWGQL